MAATPEAEQAQAEIQALVDAGTDFARKMFTKHDPWMPFGFTMTTGERLTVCVFDPSDTEGGTTQEILAFARATLAARSEPDLRAVAIVYEGLTRNADGTIKDPDAIMVEIDHCVAGAITVATPFSRKRSLLGNRTMTLSPDVTMLAGNAIAFPNPTGLQP